MAQSFSPAHPVNLQLAQAGDERRQLRLEKLGVIAGFLLGLPLALTAVHDLLADAPEAVSVLAVVVVVAATTRFGLLAASAAARRLAVR
jgi:hypothetical protein